MVTLSTPLKAITIPELEAVLKNTSATSCFQRFATSQWLQFDNFR